MDKIQESRNPEYRTPFGAPFRTYAAKMVGLNEPNYACALELGWEINL